MAGLAVLIILIVATTSYARKRKQKRLLTDASNFSFDPKDVDDGTSTEEKYSHSGTGGYHSSGHGHSDYVSNTRAASGFTGVGMGGVSRSVPSPPPPIPAYIPHDYAGHDGGYPTGYHNMSNTVVGYNPTPNPYDMYGPRNGGGYSNGQDQYDLYNRSGSSWGHRSATDPGPPVPPQLQPGVRPAQGRTFAPPLSTSPSFNRSPPTPSTILLPPASLQPSASNQDNTSRLVTHGPLPDTFGSQESDDNDAYGGISLAYDSPPSEPRRLQVN